MCFFYIMESGSALIDLSLTKKVCTFTTAAIVLVLLTMVLPLYRIPLLSGTIKLLTLILLCYTIYLNMKQTTNLRNANSTSSSYEVSNQLNVNIVSGYVFTLFLGLLALFVAKGMFA